VRHRNPEPGHARRERDLSEQVERLGSTPVSRRELSNHELNRTRDLCLSRLGFEAPRLLQEPLLEFAKLSLTAEEAGKPCADLVGARHV